MKSEPSRPMWWALLILCFLGCVRIAALAITPVPMAYDPSFRVAPVHNSAVWGPNYTQFFFGFISDYGTLVAGSDHLMLGFVVETAFVFFFLGCAYFACNGRARAMVLGFMGGLLQVTLLGAYIGLMWAVLELLPTLMVGLGLSMTPAEVYPES